uniref:Putative endodeoxyribonuclease n=1 Tax=viral metagenome TaxID=1070528 RepID=A0A6M3KPF8_9ZZZZ
MKPIRFTVNTIPKPKGRPRVVNVRGTPIAFTPKRTRSFEAQVTAAAAAAMPDGVLDEPLCVDILAVLPRPKRLCRRKDPSGLIWAPVRPDADNIRKAVLDALDGFWRDDALVVAGETFKVFAEKRDGRPRLEVIITSAPEVVMGDGWIIGGVYWDEVPS